VAAVVAMFKDVTRLPRLGVDAADAGDELHGDHMLTSRLIAPYVQTNSELCLGELWTLLHSYDSFRETALVELTVHVCRFDTHWCSAIRFFRSSEDLRKLSERGSR